MFTGMTVFCNLCNVYALLFIHDLDTYSSDVRRIFPQSNQAVATRAEYGVNCDPVTWQKLYTHLDIFAIAHLVGCAFKAIIFRQYEILWVYSIVWEMTEYCFVHLLPNFAECWWDRILLDVLVCNGVGYYIGMQFCKMNSLQMFDWHAKNVSEKLMSLCCVSTDRAEVSSEQSSTTSEKHAEDRTIKLVDSVGSSSTQSKTEFPSMNVALAIFLGLFVGQVSELNTFLYKHLFNIPAHTHLMAARTTFIAIIPIPFIANLFAMTRGPQTLTIHSKCVLLLTATDTLFSIKFGFMAFAYLDLYMVSLWVAAMIALTLVCIGARSVHALFCREDRNSYVKAVRHKID